MPITHTCVVQGIYAACAISEQELKIADADSEVARLQAAVKEKQCARDVSVAAVKAAMSTSHDTANTVAVGEAVKAARKAQAAAREADIAARQALVDVGLGDGAMQTLVTEKRMDRKRKRGQDGEQYGDDAMTGGDEITMDDLQLSSEVSSSSDGEEETDEEVEEAAFQALSARDRVVALEKKVDDKTDSFLLKGHIFCDVDVDQLAAIRERYDESVLEEILGGLMSQFWDTS